MCAGYHGLCGGRDRVDLREAVSILFSLGRPGEFERFERRTVVLFETVSCRNGSPGSKNMMEERGVGGVEIPEAGQRF